MHVIIALEISKKKKVMSQGHLPIFLACNMLQLIILNGVCVEIQTCKGILLIV